MQRWTLECKSTQKKETNATKEGKYPNLSLVLYMDTLHMAWITQATDIKLVRRTMGHLSDDPKQDHHHKNSQNNQRGDHSLPPHVMNFWSIWLVRNRLDLTQILQG